MQKTLLVCLLSLFAALRVEAYEDTAKRKIDIARLRYHESIDREQKKALGQGGIVHASQDEDVNNQVTDALVRLVNQIQDSIELSTLLDHRLKVKYLSGLENLLKGYNNGKKNHSFNSAFAPQLVENYWDLMQADIAGRSIMPIVQTASYEVSNIHINGPGTAMYENAAFSEAKHIIFLKYCAKYPDKSLSRLENYPNVPFADSIIVEAARRNPNQLYDYAAATRTNVGKLIRQNKDSLVRAITAIASSRAGQQYYPFLDEIRAGRLTIEDINKVMDDNLQYYRLLVKTQINYVQRLTRRDTPLAYDKLVAKLQNRAVSVYINQINALHDDPDPVRFRVLEPLTPQELYYLIVLGEDIIYTSSYKGVFNRMMQRTKNAAGDTLLMSVHFDRFKKFIKMAAGYNKLNEFLRSMPDTSAQRLMIAFVRGLEKTATLEEAVDVADSYGSIKEPAITQLIDQEIARNLEQSRKNGNKRSISIYDILQTIFQSAKDSTIDISARLGIPAVYKLDYKDIADDSGRVVQQVFFYGDKDGKESYANFMSMFGNGDWKVTRNAEWVEIKSKGGKSPVLIYANLPLDYEKGLDSVAQAHLQEHLQQKNLKPSVTIHRGHSYWVGSTIRSLAPTSKIVILGSCGGFHNLDDVLRTCPDAHIISSKEVGTRVVNEPILKAINDQLRQGQARGMDTDVEKELAARFPSGDARERFENYIPPYKNLGALFIKAYTRTMGDEASN